jgi:hypothetical protein
MYEAKPGDTLRVTAKYHQSAGKVGEVERIEIQRGKPVYYLRFPDSMFLRMVREHEVEASERHGERHGERLDEATAEVSG